MKFAVRLPEVSITVCTRLSHAASSIRCS
jgi:hypothetical protein